MTIEKHLANLATRCQRDAHDRWQLALRNGSLFTTTVWREPPFLFFDSDTGVNPGQERVVPLIEGLARVPGAVKFALSQGSPTIRLRAEIFLPDEDYMERRLREQIEGLKAAHRALHAGVAGESPTVRESPAEAGNTSSSELLERTLDEAGWQSHKRAGGVILVDLETPGQFLQAEVRSMGEAVRFRATVCRSADAIPAVLDAVSLYLMQAGYALRLARGFLERATEGFAAGFEVRFESAPEPAEAGYALSALSVACGRCARELDVLKDERMACDFRQLRELPLITKGAKNNG
jgi:hypothetical protein